MEVKGLDGRTYKWNVSRYRPSGRDTRPKSSYHLEARKLLKEIFGMNPIIEEVPIPGTRLKFDFYLPNQHLAIEVQGEQHYEVIPHFHRNPYGNTRMGLAAAQQRDNQKREWCELNNIQLIELSYKDDVDGWRNRIITR